MQLKRVFLGTAMALAFGVQANALVIEQSQFFGFQVDSEIGEVPGAQGATVAPAATATETLLFDFFDSSLGTLNSVEIMLSGGGRFTTQGTYDPQVSDGSQLNTVAEFNGEFDIDFGPLPGGGASFADSYSENLACNIDPLLPRCTDSFDTGLFGGVPISLSFLAADPTNFIGAGQFGMDAKASAQFRVLTLPFPIAYGFASGNGELDLTIKYDYTPGQPVIPEPSTVILLGTALLGLGVMRRRRK